MNQTSIHPQALNRILGRWNSISIILSIVIGIGIFKVPAEVAKYLGSPNLIVLAWFAGGLITLLGALCYAELSSSFPKTGGDYIYLRESYGLWAGFLFGWAELFVIRTGSIAAVSFILAEYLQSFLSLSKVLIKPIAICVVSLLAFINIIGLRYGKWVLNIFTPLNISALIIIIVLGFLSNKGDISHFDAVSTPLSGSIFPLFGLALIPILWTFGGWHENVFMGGETKDAKKSLPFALIIGVIIVTLLYLALNFLYIYIIPINEITKSDLIASDVLHILYGTNGKKAIEALVIISSLGCLNAMIMTGSRVTFAMAKDNIIFKYIGKVNTKYGTPHRAIFITAVWSIALILLGTFNKLLFFTGILVWLFFSLVVVGLFILRYKFPNIERPYKVWGYPIIPVMFILVCTTLFINTIIYYPFQSFMGICLLLSGIPVFIFSQRKRMSMSGTTNKEVINK